MIILKQVDTVKVHTRDYPNVLTNNDLNRVQKVVEIRNKVAEKYRKTWKNVVLRFVDGVVDDLIFTSKLDGRPLPEILLFEVEYSEPKDNNQDRSYKNYGTYKQDDHIYWT